MPPIGVKPGVLFDIIAPAGYIILSTLKTVAAKDVVPIIITSGTDDDHSGPTDPHKLGEAYDVRSQNMSHLQKAEFMDELDFQLGRIRFYYFLEADGLNYEHFHIQRRKRTVFTAKDLLDWVSPGLRIKPTTT